MAFARRLLTFEIAEVGRRSFHEVVPLHTVALLDVRAGTPAEVAPVIRDHDELRQARSESRGKEEVLMTLETVNRVNRSYVAFEDTGFARRYHVSVPSQLVASLHSSPLLT